MISYLIQIFQNNIDFNQTVSSLPTCTQSCHIMGPDFSPENCGYYRNGAVLPNLRSLDSPHLPFFCKIRLWELLSVSHMVQQKLYHLSALELHSLSKTSGFSAFGWNCFNLMHWAWLSHAAQELSLSGDDIMGILGDCGDKNSRRGPRTLKGWNHYGGRWSSVLRIRKHESLPWLQLIKPLNFSGPSSPHLESGNNHICLRVKWKCLQKNKMLSKEQDYA